MDKGIELVLVWRLRSTCPTLCYKKIRTSPKIRVRPSGTLSQTLDLENFADKFTVLLTKLVTVELVDDSHDSQQVVAGRTRL